MTNDSFPKPLRIQRQADFDRAYASGTFAADDVLVICGGWNGRAETRLGLSVSRAVGNAVVRNRWKRRIREAFRKSKANLPSGLDLVVRPKKGARLDFTAIQNSLPRLANKLAKKLPSHRNLEP